MTTPLQRPGRRGLTPAPLVGAVQRIEAAEALEIPARVLTQLADRVLMSDRTRSTLRGEPLGHALHPLLTDFPLGAWMSTSLLDLFGGRRARPAATGLLAFGVVAAVPTALAGLAEYGGGRWAGPGGWASCTPPSTAPPSLSMRPRW